jgi:hypothetical protein
MGFTSSAAPSTDSVTFRPESITSVSSTDAGNDWGGIIFDSYSAGSVLESATVGYAATPVFLFYPDSQTTISKSRIHHFASTGLWVYGSLGVGGDVSDTVIDRGIGLHESLGATGVFLDKVTNFRFGSSCGPNLVVLQGASDNAGGVGIAASLGKTLCLSTGGGSDDLLRIGNTTVIGPSTVATPDPNGDWSGIRLSWVCGSSNRAVEIAENYIEGLDFAGLDLEQAVDVQVSCNRVVKSRRGFVFSRDAEATGPGVRFRDNSLEQIDFNDIATASTNSSFKVKMGPASSSDRGKNVLKVWDSDVRFIENDEPGSDVLNAKNNYWYLQHSGSEEFLSQLPPMDEDENAEIDKRCRTSTGDYYSADATTDVSDHKLFETGIVVCASRHPDAPGSARLAGVGPGGRPEQLLRVGGDIPLETSLGAPYPNPMSDGIAIPFALSRMGERDVRLDVYDVTGRRVLAVHRGPLDAGRYRTVWSGRDASGTRVSPGVYFVRLSASRYTRTTKVTVLR